MKYLFLIFFLSSLVQAGGLTNQTPDYTEIHKPYLSMACIDAQNQHEMDACGEKSLASTNRRMEEILTNLKKDYKTSEPDLFESLISSQKSWETYKETSCKLETYYSREGSGFNAIWNGCLESKINERISYLNTMKDNP
ncbi:MAG: DUF1311 domain-containing protein [Gammaproteobacteria bacterium]|nr:DUF1311 domain-containing protein [Gammaproteobacteria bacterium]